MHKPDGLLPTNMMSSLAMTLKRLVLFAVLVLPMTTGGAPAWADPSPEHLGAFAGAMRYCADNAPGLRHRVGRARLHAAREVDAMRPSERRRAIRARDRAYANGQFLGRGLDRRACERLLRAAEWSRFDRD